MGTSFISIKDVAVAQFEFRDQDSGRSVSLGA